MTNHLEAAAARLNELKAESVRRRQTRAAAMNEPSFAAAYEATRMLPCGGMKQRIEMLDGLPRGYAEYYDMTVGAIRPENRSMYRQPHFRFQVRIADKVVSEARAIEAIAARLAAG